MSYILPRVSVTVNLRQAIASSDERQILVCLTNVDAKTISATAKELTSQEATVLLEVLEKMITSEPRRFLVVIEWTRELLIAHASFIASQTGTKMRLKPIYDALIQRLDQQGELVRLKQTTEALVRVTADPADTINTPTSATVEMMTESLLRWSPLDE